MAANNSSSEPLRKIRKMDASSKKSAHSPKKTIKDLLLHVAGYKHHRNITLDRLKVLDLCKMSLSTLPEGIRLLKSLEILDISQNDLTELPNSVGFLKNLRRLNVSYNRLANIPENICQLKELITLDLSENGLTEIPASVCKLTNLVELDASHNKIEAIPKSIGNLVKLENMQLSFNCIKQIAREMIGCINLRRFILKNNKNLQIIPEGVLNLPHLEAFFADGCNLIYLPSILSPSLKRVGLFERNQPTHIPIIYEKFLKDDHYPEILIRKEFSPSGFIIHLREEENNSILLLPFGTRKVFHIDDNKPFSLFELALRAACERKDEFVEALPNIMREFVERGPIAQCSYSECSKKLCSEYFLHIVKRKKKNCYRELLFSCNFCSVSCAQKCIRCNETKYKDVSWCIL